MLCLWNNCSRCTLYCVCVGDVPSTNPHTTDRQCISAYWGNWLVIEQTRKSLFILCRQFVLQVQLDAQLPQCALCHHPLLFYSLQLVLALLGAMLLNTVGVSQPDHMSLTTS